MKNLRYLRYWMAQIKKTLERYLLCANAATNTRDNVTFLARLLNKLEPPGNQLIEGKTCRLHDNVVFYVNVLVTSGRHYGLAMIVTIKHYRQMRFALNSQTIITLVINFIVYLSQSILRHRIHHVLTILMKHRKHVSMGVVSFVQNTCEHLCNCVSHNRR